MNNVSMLGAALALVYVWNQFEGDADASFTDSLFGPR
jgi:hypothetical protein